MDVGEWLKGLRLGQYASASTENDIDFAVLGKLTDADLKQLGVSSLGHRKRLLEAIAAPRAEPGEGALSARSDRGTAPSPACLASLGSRPLPARGER